jgi:undecaprenyl-diphosphatase
MPSISALILGLLQGLTEFLPVSSSGHLVLGAALLDYRSPGLILETVVHLATSLAVIIYFRRRFASVLRGMLRDADSRKLVVMLGLAFTTTALVGLALDRTGVIGVAFGSPVMTGAMLLITALALVSVRRLRPPLEVEDTLRVTWKVALLVGLAQGAAIFPGISRSGFTIVAGLWGGLGRNSAAEFSFLLSVPTILAASLYELWREPDLAVAGSYEMAAAAAVAFVTGLAAIHWLMRWLRQGRLWWFSGYCAVVGSLAVLLWGFYWN